MGAQCSAILDQVAASRDLTTADYKQWLSQFGSAADVDAFWAASEWMPVQKGTVMGEQDKPVDYIYVITKIPDGCLVYRAWNETEKRFGLTIDGVALKGFGLYPDEAYFASYQSGCNEIPLAKLWEPNPTYVHTTVVTDLDKEKVRRMPIAAWAGLPEGFKSKVIDWLKEEHEAWIGRWRENEFGRVETKKEQCDGYGKLSPENDKVAAQFKVKQAEWKLTHWGTLKFVYGVSEDCGEIIHDPDTQQPLRREGYAYIVCHNPNASEPNSKKYAIARELKWEEPYIKASDSYGPRVLLNVPYPAPEMTKGRYTRRIDLDSC